MNAVTEMLGCQHPIILGAMGVICNPRLVAAVSEVGGYGLLATAFAQNGDVLRKQIQETKKLTGNPFGANIFAMNPLVPEFIDILAEEGVHAVTVSGGSPKEIIPMLHEKDIKAIVVVPTADVARRGLNLVGADVVEVSPPFDSSGKPGLSGRSS
jgi:enoyl-[acyl-carrier protein] reductase II